MSTWPESRRFAFTVVDDTDFAVVDNVRPVYDLLVELGMRTTKTVWPLAPDSATRRTTGGSTLADAGYRAWIRDLAASGFEIASHGTTDHPSTRDQIAAGLDCFRETLGHDPRLHANHTGQLECIYWGEARLDGLPRLAYVLANRLRGIEPRYYGHDAASPYFWGDLCRERVTYVRNFAFRDIDTLACDPMMPYHDSRRPFVPFWFSCSEGARCDSFCATISEDAQDRLVASGGACIMYTHFGVDFVRHGRVDPTFARLMRRLASLPGWFVPASTLLDHLRTQPGWRPALDPRALRRMQWRWLSAKLAHGRS